MIDNIDPWEIDRTPETDGLELVTINSAYLCRLEYGFDEAGDLDEEDEAACRDFENECELMGVACTNNGIECSGSFGYADYGNGLLCDALPVWVRRR